MAFRLGCQTITFGNEMHRTDLPAVLDAVRDAGFDGVEIGFFRLDPGRAEETRALLDERGLALTAVHIGGNILDTASQHEQMDDLDAVIGLVKALGGSYVFLSGTREDFLVQAAKYDAMGARVRAAGLTLCYHNHDWEIRDDMRGLRLLMAHTRPENLSLVMDVGWVTRGGADPVAAIHEFSARLENVHCKEFTAEGGFAELGTGIVNFPGVFEAIRGRDMWVVAEQDESKIGAARSVRENAAYLREALGRES